MIGVVVLVLAGAAMSSFGGIMDSSVVEEMQNGFWRLRIMVRRELVDAVPEVTFWGARMDFYYRRVPGSRAWQLAAIGRS